MTVLRVLRWELFKLLRRRASYVGFGLCVLFCAVVMLGFAYSQWRGLRANAGFLADPSRFVNGYFYANFCLEIASFSLLPLFAAVIPGSQLAGEARDGTLRALLVRPPSRPAVFAAKAIASYAWIQLMVLFLLGFALVLGLIALGGGDLMIYVWEYRRQGPWFADSDDRIWIFLTTAAACGASLFMVCAFALMLSSFTDNPVVAHVGTLGAFFISSVVQRLPERVMEPEFKAMMPTKHMSFWHELQHLWHPDPTRFDAARMWNDLTWVTSYTALFLLIGLTVFWRRDITA
ncbi:MAG TPA: ABC transporter permease subunit [Kofleriaceae bacterium]|nr:ABC transporter permease subunit [Kofleriaceae bacterium]